MGPDGEQRGSSTIPTPFTTRNNDSEMAVDDLLDAVARLLAGLGDDLAEVEAVGVAGVAESGAPVDGDGRALAPVIAWHDPRGEEAVKRLNEHFGDELARCIGQPLRTVSSVAKLGWLLDHGIGGLRRWLGVPELCLFHLSGCQATEHSLAARTGAYHVVERTYMPDVAGALGFDPEVLAPVLPAGSAMGRVSATGSARSGLREGIPVTIAGHDHLAGAEGVGAGPHDVVNSVGTAETVMRRTPRPPDVDKALELRTAVTLRPGGEEWVVLASAARAGLVLEAAAEALGHSLEELDDLAEEAEKSGTEAVEVSDETVRSIQSGEPPELPDAPPGAVWNGLLRALSERTFESSTRLFQLLGPGERLIVFGGGSRSDPWMETKATMTDLPVFRSRVPDAVVHGAACFAGVAAGAWATVEEAPASALDEPARTR
jgi:xylulokinase